MGHDGRGWAVGEGRVGEGQGIGAGTQGREALQDHVVDIEQT